MSHHPRPSFVFMGHSTVRCDLPSGEVVLIDPWVTTNPFCPDHLKQLPRIDAMLITHGHGDHMADAVELALKYKPKKIVAAFEICHWLSSKGVENCSGMNIGGTQEVLGLQATMVNAVHSSAIEDGGKMVSGGAAAGFVVKLPGGYTFYLAGDTSLFSDMQLIGEMYRPELAFLPIGDHYTMDALQAARACRYLGIRKVVPIHWGTFPVLTGTPTKLVAALEDLGVKCEVIAMNAGDTH
jgi:L-ascorbate metabolism protein UlaG (beta-lactamase superfamily)